MKKLTSFQIILLSVFGALAAAGVLVFALAVGGGQSTSIGAVTIWGTLDSQAFDSVLQSISDNDPDFNQVSYVQQDPSTYESDLSNALAEGTGPDLFIISGDEAIADAPKITAIPYSTLSQSAFQSTFADAADVFLTSTGALGIPIAIDPLILYWNRDLLASAGFPQPPQYWGQLPAMAQSISEKDDSGAIIQSAIALGGYENIPDAKAILSAMLLQSGDSITTRDESGDLISELAPKSGNAAQAGDTALSFYTEFANPSQSDYSWNGSLQSAPAAFAAGELAMYIGYASDEPKISATNPNLDFSAAALPQLQAQSGASIVSVDTGEVYALAIPKAAKNPQGALTVAYTLISSANASALSQALGIPSARRDVLMQEEQTQTATSGDQQLFAKEAVITHSWLDPDPSQTDGVFQAMIDDTVSGAVTVADAVARADQQLTAIIGQ